jgi:hypothetical protein
MKSEPVFENAKNIHANKKLSIKYTFCIDTDLLCDILGFLLELLKNANTVVKIKTALYNQILNAYCCWNAYSKKSIRTSSVDKVCY